MQLMELWYMYIHMYMYNCNVVVSAWRVLNV